MKIFCFILLQITSAQQQLLKIINTFQSNETTKNCNISMCIKDAKSDSSIFSFFENKSMPPASTLKLLTTGTALNILGKDFKFETSLVLKGKIIDSVLYGDVIIKTNKDPTFGSQKFIYYPLIEFANAIINQNIRKIKGKILTEQLDEFNLPSSWPIGDVGNYYGSFPKNVNYKENSFSVFLNSGKFIGDTVTIAEILPFSKKWNIINKLKTAEVGTGDQVIIYNLPFSNDIFFSGTVPLNAKNFEVKGAIPDVSTILISEFENILKEKKIEILNQDFVFDFLPNELKIHTFESPSLDKIIETCNFKSVNFFAEGISNYLINSSSDSLNDFDNFLKKYWQKENLNFSSFNFEDGSGLSPVNFISTSALCSFLSKMTKKRDFNSFFESIPVVGKSGTVANLKIPNGAKDKIRAKSGSISSVRNYAGYFTNSKNELFSFSIFINGFNDKAKEEIKKIYENLFKIMTDIHL